MKVKAAKIMWNENLLNEADLCLLVDKIPSIADVNHDVVATDDGIAYCGQKDGYVSFLFKANGNSSGFGGSSFSLNVGKDKVILHGPWSSRAGAMNVLFPQHQCVDVYFSDDPESFAKGFYTHGAVTLAVAHAAIRMIHPHLSLAMKRVRGDIVYRIDKDQRKLLVG